MRAVRVWVLALQGMGRLLKPVRVKTWITTFLAVCSKEAIDSGEDSETKGLDEHGGRVDFGSDRFQAMMRMPEIRRRQREDVVLWWRQPMMSIICTLVDPCSVGREIRQGRNFRCDCKSLGF